MRTAMPLGTFICIAQDNLVFLSDHPAPVLFAKTHQAVAVQAVRLDVGRRHVGGKPEHLVTWPNTQIVRGVRWVRHLLFKATRSMAPNWLAGNTR